VGWLHNDKG